jgi:hypothetical protein
MQRRQWLCSAMCSLHLQLLGCCTLEAAKVISTAFCNLQILRLHAHDGVGFRPVKGHHRWLIVWHPGIGPCAIARLECYYYTALQVR